MSIFDRFKNHTEDPDTSTLWTTPWRWRTADGIYVGWNGTVWAYRAFDLHPISPDWEDPAERLSVQRRLQTLLTEIGETSREAPPGLRSTVSDYREIHLVGITWEDDARPPEGTPEPLAEYMGEFLGFAVPRKTVMIGMRLRRSGIGAGLPGGSKKLLEQLKAQISTLLAEDVPPLEQYVSDIELFDTLVSRNRGRVPTSDELAQLEAWYNLGRSPDALIYEERDHLRIEEIDKVELAAVVDFSTLPHYAPFFQWAAEAESHAEGARMISVRGELEPAGAVRRRARNSQRRIRAQIDEESKSGDIDRPEYSDIAQLAANLEEHFMSTNEPLLTKCSIVMARRATNADETYIDYLRNYFGIEVRPLTMRQLPALEETLPCARARVNPHVQDVTIGMISYAGMLAHSSLGDDTGVYLGLSQPNQSLAFMDLLGAPARNKTPICAIFGEPGSGKAQPLDAKLLTPTGWVRMGDIAVGDEVIGSDGRATRVLGVYPQGDRPIVRMRFNDGSSVECDTEHYWVTSPHGPDVVNRQWEEIDTAEVAARVARGEDVHIPVVAPIHFSEAAAPFPHVDPREVGAALAHTDPDETRPEFDRRWLTAPLPFRASLLDAYLTAAGAERGESVITVTDSPGWLYPLVQSVGGVATRDGNWSRIVLHTDNPDRWVVGVEEVGLKPAQCIQVEAEDHIYVTEDYLCTRNTFLAQSISHQAVLSGKPVIFINPKGHDSLANLAAITGGQVVSMSKMASAAGAFDPFRYEEPEVAAEILGTHILSVMEFSEPEELRLTYGLMKGAERGARCAKEALLAVEDRDILTRVAEQVKSSPLFALGFGMEPAERLGTGGGLTLIEFDRKLDLPDPHAQPDTYKRPQRIALAAISLVTRASLSVLARAGGGVMVLDEAWTFLSHPAGMAAMQQLGREGRSLNVLPIFATQRVSDLLGSDMEGYISRVFCMQMRDEKEATAALQICGLEPTPGRLRWLSEAGPQPRRGSTPARWAMALHRDLDNRHAALLLGPTPQRSYEAYTTNPLEREELRRRQTGTGDTD